MASLWMGEMNKVIKKVLETSMDGSVLCVFCNNYMGAEMRSEHQWVIPSSDEDSGISELTSAAINFGNQRMSFGEFPEHIQVVASDAGFVATMNIYGGVMMIGFEKFGCDGGFADYDELKDFISVLANSGDMPVLWDVNE